MCSARFSKDSAQGRCNFNIGSTNYVFLRNWYKARKSCISGSRLRDLTQDWHRQRAAHFACRCKLSPPCERYSSWKLSHTLAQRRTFLGSARATNRSRLRVRTHFTTRVLFVAHAPHSHVIWLLFMNNSHYIPYFSFSYCPRGKGLPTVDSSGNVSTPLRNDCHQLLIHICSTWWSFQNATPLMVTIGCTCNIQWCLSKKCNKQFKSWRDLWNWSKSFLDSQVSQNTILRQQERHTKFWLGNIMERIFSTKHKNIVTFTLDTLLRRQSIKTVQAVQYSSYEYPNDVHTVYRWYTAAH
jgi:hypothetical protein